MLCCFAVAFFLGIFAMFRGEGKLIRVILYGFLTYLGLGFLMLGVDEKKLYKKFSPYSDILSGYDFLSLEQVASITGNPVDIACLDIEMMIRKGYIQYSVSNEDGTGYTAYIGNTGIHMKGEIPVADDSGEDRKNPAEGQRLSVNCPSCGGLNRIMEGKDSVCEYCGSKMDN